MEDPGKLGVSSQNVILLPFRALALLVVQLAGHTGHYIYGTRDGTTE